MRPFGQRKFIGQGRVLLCFSAAFSVSVLIFTLLFPHGRTAAAIGTGAAAALLTAALILLYGGAARYTVMGLAAGVLWCMLYVMLIYAPAAELDGAAGRISFTADEYAMGYESYGAVYGTVREINGEPCRTRALLYLLDGSPDIAPGDRLEFEGSVRVLEPDYSKNRLQNGYFLTVRQSGFARVEAGADMSPLRHARRLSGRIGALLAGLLPEDEAGLLSALLSGDRSGYSDELRYALSVSGTSHITAVSGLHVAIAAAFMVTLFGKRAGMYLSVPCVLAYAAITGFSPSVLRASVMILLSVLSFALRRERDTATALMTALLLILAANPFAVMSVSLQLSFAAVAGILLFAEPLMESMRVPVRNRYLRVLVDYAVSALGVSLAATALTMPVGMLYFSRTSVISLLSNLLVLWAVGPVLILGMVQLLVLLMSTGAAAIFARYVLYLPLRYLTAVIKWLGGLGFASVSSASPYLMLAAALIIAILTLARLRRLPAHYPAGLLMSVLVLLLCIGFNAAEKRIYSDIAVGGHSGAAVIAVRSPGGTAAIGCGGAGGRGVYFLENTLRDWGEQRLDALILPADSGKLAGGENRLRAALPVGAVYRPSGSGEGYAFAAGGCVRVGTAAVELIDTGTEAYAVRVTAGGKSVLSLCGLKPEAARGSVMETDVLLIDGELLDIAGELVAASGAGTLLVSDSVFDGRGSEAADAEVIYLGETERFMIRSRER
ncbi:MAG: ComEC/Rec2 family competence protein [Clostridia bacterium]|nr:ComEC/Rec2 family competence protein [Clostridia bacterium]